MSRISFHFLSPRIIGDERLDPRHQQYRCRAFKTVVQVRVTIVKKTFEHIRDSATLALREVKVSDLRV